MCPDANLRVMGLLRWGQFPALLGTAGRFRWPQPSGITTKKNKSKTTTTKKALWKEHTTDSERGATLLSER